MMTSEVITKVAGKVEAKFTRDSSQDNPEVDKNMKFFSAGNMHYSNRWCLKDGILVVS